MKMQKSQFRIGELAKQLNVEKFVIRFWEKEFRIASTRSDGGQRFYTQDDLDNFHLIKTLLYDKGFTIAGAKKLIADNKSPQKMVGSYKTDMQASQHKSSTETTLSVEKLMTLREKLIALQNLL